MARREQWINTEGSVAHALALSTRGYENAATSIAATVEVGDIIAALVSEVAGLRRVLAAAALLRYGTDKRLAPPSTETEEGAIKLLEQEVRRG